MKISNREVNGVTIMDFQGRITYGPPSTQLRSQVDESLQRGRTEILLNLGGVSFIDSFGLGVLIESLKKVDEHGGALKLLNVTKGVKQLLVITKLVTEMDCFDDETEALASFH